MAHKDRDDNKGDSMTIIKHGSRYKGPVTLTCPKCGCEFIAEPKDTTCVKMNHNGTITTIIKCPECYEEIAFSKGATK
jgi:hypothetical protein